MENDLFANLYRLHTTALGEQRIRQNLGLDPREDVIDWCKGQIAHPESITRRGKNWYVRGQGFVMTVNAGSYTVITARQEKPKKGSDMNDVGIIKKLDDNPRLRQELIALFDEKTHIAVSQYGLLLAEHIRELAHTPRGSLFVACYEVNQRWQAGNARFQEARAIADNILDAAREEKDGVKEKVLRVLAQVAVIPHVKRHALIASDYAVKTINLLYPGNQEEVERERYLQIELMKKV